MPDALGKTANIVSLTGGQNFRTFQEIEALHRAQLAAGALAHMPAGFLASFYRYLATRTDCAVFVAETEGRVAGFVAGSLHASGLLKSFLLAEPLRALGYGARLLLAPRLLFRITSLARYLAAGGRDSDMDERQLLSIAVHPDDLRSRVGTGLFSALSDWFRSRDAEDFGVIAAKTQTAALQFYRRCGAAEVGETRLGGLSSIRFRCALHPAAPDHRKALDS
jgi:GNAT superfamily N-acetyltransferase